MFSANIKESHVTECTMQIYFLFVQVPVTLTHQISHGEESSESKQLYELYEQCKSLTCSELIRRINLETPHQIVCFVYIIRG